MNKRHKWRKTKIYEHSERESRVRYPNIPPHGDPITPRYKGDGIIRFGFQNVRGTSINEGLETAEEIEVKDYLGVNVQGNAETNRP